MIKAIRGMNDLLPEQTPLWQFLEAKLRALAAEYGYQEIRMPILEKTGLFQRGIGEATDIVEKEMYTFSDRGGDSLTMRPEGTAGCVRAAIEHGLLYNQQQRLWYMGPIFRYERPQKGRYRQFHQFGVEVFGLDGPDADADIILMSARLWQMLGIADKVELHLNSLGSSAERANYRSALVEYFEAHRALLDPDSVRRLASNPLRLLDSKNPQMQALIEHAPLLTDFLGESSQRHFDTLRDLLRACGVPYVVDPRLVRGLDYYNGIVFEWMTDTLGAQGTLCGGGRYDGLVEQLGGHETPGVGFGLGIERVVLMLENMGVAEHLSGAVDVYLMGVGERAQRSVMPLAEKIRDLAPTLKVLAHCGGGSFKKLIKRADKSGARWAMIVGEDELDSAQISVKPLRTDEAQFLLGMDELQVWLENAKNVQTSTAME